MLKKKNKFILLIIMFIVLVFTMSFNIVKAEVPTPDGGGDVSWSGRNIDSMFGQAQNFISMGEQGGSQGKETPLSSEEISSVLRPIGEILVAIGAVVLVVVTIMMGIKYMTGNPDDKGKLKQQLVGLIVAIVVIFGAWGIWAFVYNLMSNISAPGL